jgi:uncharacterized protein YndB with AHSA1/START domain
VAAEAFATSVHIAAPPEADFPYLTQADQLVRWMGPFAALDPRPGGEFAVDINGMPVRGRYLELDPPHRVVLSWGVAGSDEVPPGSTTVEVTLQPVDGGTLLELVHRDLPDGQAERHAIGWNHFVPRLAVAGAGDDPGPDPWASGASRDPAGS